MIYLDNAATTPLSEMAAKEQVYWACSNFFNPSATYLPAVKVAQKLGEARDRLKKLLGAKDGDIIFTSGATEANNLAIRGSLRGGEWEYVFSAGEHPSVLNLAKALESEGKSVKFASLTSSGQVDLDALEKLLTPRTRLVSCMYVSNVTGAANDIKKLSQIVRKKSPRALIHVDGVQAFCKLPFKLSQLDVDLFAISAHKFHGPKGVGALYVKNKAALKNMVYGGGQEFGLRSGTENVAGIMAMLAAAEEIDVSENYEKVSKIKAAFVEEIKCDGIESLNFESSSPYILTLLCAGVNGETLVRMLEDEVIVGRGSACSSKKAGNHVLEAMKISLEKIKGALRVSFDASLTLEEAKSAAKIIKEKYQNLAEKME